MLESAISQTAVIQSGYINNKSETQILKVSNKEVKKCYRCDGNYAAKSCGFINKECFYCHNKGHTRKVCHKKAKANKVIVSNVVQTKENSIKVDDDEFYDIYSLSMLRNPLLVVEAKINGADVKMEVNTGASRSIINMETYNTIKRKSDSLTYTKSKLRTYLGNLMKPEGVIEASFMYENQCLVVPFIVANTKGPNLLGRDVLRLLQLNWEKFLNVYYVEENVRTENCLNKISDYKEVLKSKMSTLKGFEVELKIDPDCKPKFCKARSVLYALNKRIEKELERLVEDNIYEPIQYSKWEASIVPILKDDSTVRICGDYKQPGIFI